MAENRRTIHPDEKSKLYQKLKNLGGKEIPISPDKVIRDEDLGQKIRRINEMKRETGNGISSCRKKETTSSNSESTETGSGTFRNQIKA